MLQLKSYSFTVVLNPNKSKITYLN